MFRDSSANFKPDGPQNQILTCPICSSFPNFNILQFLKTHPYFDPIGGAPPIR
jgi:C4-type Zn-finger protein